MERQRISELPNKITETVDTASPEDMLDMLKRSDDQMFEGWEDYLHVFSDCHVQTLARIASAASNMLQDNVKNNSKNIFVFSGCGTSGRIAWLCTRKFNQWLTKRCIPPCFFYLIAGGDPSLIRGDELPEDDPLQGAEELEEITRDSKSAMYFGITCGLSAPYVAGQINYAIQKETVTPVLVGFNPVCLARNMPIEKWQQKTCREVFLSLEEEVKRNHGFIVNPVVGPESITGSTRMKGGSMTKILLETIFLTAFHQLILTCHPLTHPVSSDRPATEPIHGHESVLSHVDGSEGLVRHLLDFYHCATQSGYCSDSISLAAIISKAGGSLCKPNGHLYYIGLDSYGLIGLVDGSEMLATFGSSVDDVRGFVEGGWLTCNNQCGDISETGHVFRVSTEQFETDILPNLTRDDLIIFLGPDISSAHLLDKISQGCAQLARIAIAEPDGQSRPPSKVPNLRYCAEAMLKPTRWTSRDDFTFTHEAEELALELSMKVAMNAVSTGANIMIGKVYGNTMINVTVANNKLFYRSIGIVSQLSGKPKDICHAALLSVIYNGNTQVDKVKDRQISEHIQAALKVQMVVPKSILLASGRARTVDEAHKMLQSQTSIRLLVQQT